MVALPNDEQRLVLLGKTGSGKTQAGIWHLSQRSFDLMPWVAINFKRDQSIAGIPGIEVIDLDTVPTKPGIYELRPLAEQQEELSDWFFKVWEQENVGLFVDEGFMIDRNNRGFGAVLMQGRSKHIPVITCTQRPVWINRYVLSESDFFQVFYLNHAKDRKNIAEFISDEHDLESRLPEYHSRLYNVASNELTVLKPVPPLEEIYEDILDRYPEIPEDVPPEINPRRLIFI